jgi:Fe-S-cluster containining protein
MCRYPIPAKDRKKAIKEAKKNKCKRCGKCCDAIPLNYDLNKLSKASLKDQSNSFVYNSWIKISLAEAFVRNPYLRKLYNKQKKPNFYKCDCYDTNTKTCKSYKNRPNVCKHYPNYPHKTYFKQLEFREFLMSEDCGYHLNWFERKLLKMYKIITE